jgi:UPF0176 protein
MQLYNMAEERAIMIDDSENKDLLCLSMLMRKSRPYTFRNDLFLAWNPLGVLGRIYVANGNQLIVPSC